MYSSSPPYVPSTPINRKRKIVSLKSIFEEEEEKEKKVEKKKKVRRSIGKSTPIVENHLLILSKKAEKEAIEEIERIRQNKLEKTRLLLLEIEMKERHKREVEEEKNKKEIEEKKKEKDLRKELKEAREELEDAREEVTRLREEKDSKKKKCRSYCCTLREQWPGKMKNKYDKSKGSYKSIISKQKKKYSTALKEALSDMKASTENYFRNHIMSDELVAANEIAEERKRKAREAKEEREKMKKEREPPKTRQEVMERFPHLNNQEIDVYCIAFKIDRESRKKEMNYVEVDNEVDNGGFSSAELIEDSETDEE